MNRLWKVVCLLIVLLGVSLYAAATTRVPHTFKSGELISAQKMNENFQALTTAIGNTVTSLNGQHGELTLEGGSNVSIDASRNGRLIISATTSSSGPASTAWSDLTGVPGDLADGDDDTNYSAGAGLILSGTTFALGSEQQLPASCSSGEAATWNGSTWSCRNAVQESFGGINPPADGREYDCVLGDVWLTAGAVGGAAVAQGQLLQISQNQALFSLLGTKYGGDGRTTFALPDLQQVAPRSANGVPVYYVICTQGVFPSRY